MYEERGGERKEETMEKWREKIKREEEDRTRERIEGSRKARGIEIRIGIGESEKTRTKKQETKDENMKNGKRKAARVAARLKARKMPSPMKYVFSGARIRKKRPKKREKKCTSRKKRDAKYTSVAGCFFFFTPSFSSRYHLVRFWTRAVAAVRTLT